MSQPDPMTDPKFKQAADFATSRLAQFEPRDHVLDDLVEKFGVDYPSAEQIVQYVESHDEGQVQVRQLPLIAVLGVGTTIAGGFILWAYLQAPIRSGWLLVTGIGMSMGGLVGLLEALFGLVSRLFRRG